MRWYFPIIAIVFMIIFGGVNLYIGSNVFKILRSMISSISKKLFWIVFWAIALAYIAGRLGEGIIPDVVSDVLIQAGSYWMAAMVYFILILVFKDIIRLLDRRMGFIPDKWKSNPRVIAATGVTMLIAVIAIIVYGAWNARVPRITNYDLAIPKNSSIDDLHIVMVSDVHLGNIVDNKRLNEMVSLINGLEPDIVLMAGDIIDESVKPFVEQKMGETFRLLDSKYGVYSVMGNHEYIGEHGGDAIRELSGAGIRVLRDEVVKVADSIYIVGRDDPSGETMSGQRRSTLGSLLEDVDMSCPVIVLDHRPTSIGEAENSGADLQLSGHTHHAQMFPGQIINSFIYEKDWGYLKKGSYQLIVSSGYGTWGPPVRVGTISEIVDINLHFTGVESHQ